MSKDIHKKLLLVDDEAIIAMSTAGMLKHSGYDVVTAYNGRKAIETALADVSIDLVLMDIDLGSGINGPEAARQILEKRNIPIVFLTSHSEKNVVEMVKEITRYGYVIKNSGDFVLLSSIEMAFELFNSNRRLQQTADNLRASEEQHSEVTNNMVDLVARLDAGKFYQYVSPSFERVLGYTPGELIGTWAPEYIHPSDRERGLDELMKVCTAEEGFTEIREKHKDATYRWFEVTGRNIYRGDGVLIGTVLGGRDITGRKNTERELRKKDRQYKALFDSMIDGFALHKIVTDDQGRAVDYIFLEVNPAFERFTGLKAEEITGRRVTEILPDNEKYWIETYGRVALTGEHVIIENFSSPLNRWYKVSAYSTEKGVFATIFEDITDRKSGEELLKESDERYRRLFESVSGYVYTVYFENRKPVRTVHGPGCEIITGYTPENFADDPDLWFKIIYPEDRESVLIFASSISDKGIFSSVEHRIIRSDGKVLWVRNTPVPHYDNDGNLIEYDSVITDITDRKSAEQSLREMKNINRQKKTDREFQGSEEILWNILNSSPDLIYVKDQDLKLVLCNVSYASALNKSTGQLTGKTDIENGLDEESVIGNIQKGIKGYREGDLRALSGERVSVLNEPFIINGQIRYFDTVKLPMYREGKIVSMLGISRDVTDRLTADRERKAIIGLMRIINTSSDMHDFMKSVLIFLKSWSGCDAVGIRYREGDDYPYYETDGFPDDFLRTENKLCAYDLDGQLLRDDAGNPVLDCMCGNIICGRFDPAKPFFTENGSFWSNCTTDLLRSTTEADRQSRTRNRCNGMGYESVALVPLRTADKTFGLIQLNDKRKGMFSEKLIGMFELLGNNIAIALSEMMIRKDLSESFEKYRTVADYTYDWEYWIGPDGEMIYCSPSCERITGYSSAEFMSNPELLHSIIVPDDRQKSCSRRRNESGQHPINESEYRIIRKDGETRWIGQVCRKVYNAACDFTGWRGSNRDITDQKLSRLETEAALKEKELLLGEVHHRIKNNMNTISGLLMLQADSIGDSAAANALNDAHSRVQCMMILYDKLYRSEDYSNMQVREYLEKFIDEIFVIFNKSERVSIEKNIEDITLDTRILFSLGIIINELITNAFKYAFRDDRDGLIKVTVEKNDRLIFVTVRDNGPGIPDRKLESHDLGFGLNLVSALAEQLDGEMKISNDNGAAVKIIFKTEENSQ